MIYLSCDLDVWLTGLIGLDTYTGSIFNLSLRVVYCVQTNEINPGMNLDTLTPLYFTFISIKFIQPTRH